MFDSELKFESFGVVHNREADVHIQMEFCRWFAGGGRYSKADISCPCCGKEFLVHIQKNKVVKIISETAAADASVEGAVEPKRTEVAATVNAGASSIAERNSVVSPTSTTSSFQVNEDLNVGEALELDYRDMDIDIPLDEGEEAIAVGDEFAREMNQGTILKPQKSSAVNPSASEPVAHAAGTASSKSDIDFSDLDLEDISTAEKDESDLNLEELELEEVDLDSLDDLIPSAASKPSGSDLDLSDLDLDDISVAEEESAAASSSESAEQAEADDLDLDDLELDDIDLGDLDDSDAVAEKETAAVTTSAKADGVSEADDLDDLDLDDLDLDDLDLGELDDAISEEKESAPTPVAKETSAPEIDLSDLDLEDISAAELEDAPAQEATADSKGDDLDLDDLDLGDLDDIDSDVEKQAAPVAATKPSGQSEGDDLDLDDLDLDDLDLGDLDEITETKKKKPAKAKKAKKTKTKAQSDSGIVGLEGKLDAALGGSDDLGDLDDFDLSSIESELEYEDSSEESAGTESGDTMEAIDVAADTAKVTGGFLDDLDIPDISEASDLAPGDTQLIGPDISGEELSGKAAEEPNFNVFLSRITDYEKRETVTEKLVELNGISEQEAEAMVDKIIIPVARNVSKAQADFVLDEYKKLGVVGRVTERKR